MFPFTCIIHSFYWDTSHIVFLFKELEAYKAVNSALGRLRQEGNELGYVARSCLKKEKDKGCDSVVEYLGSKCEALSSVPGATRVDTQVYLRLRDNKQDYMARAWTAWPEPGLHSQSLDCICHLSRPES